MNWESQVSTENNTEFHTANNSKNSQTKDLNQIFTKPIESETEANTQVLGESIIDNNPLDSHTW